MPGVLAFGLEWCAWGRGPRQRRRYENVCVGVEMQDRNVLCPICGLPMRQTRRGATLKKRGPSYICPKDEAETWTDERGHMHRIPESTHKPSLRIWEASEVGQ